VSRLETQIATLTFEGDVETKAEPSQAEPTPYNANEEEETKGQPESAVAS